MSISQISAYTANPMQVNPPASEKSSTAQASQSVQKSVSAPKADTVTISKQAILMNSKTYSPAEEAQESAADKAFEKSQGQR